MDRETSRLIEDAQKLSDEQLYLQLAELAESGVPLGFEFGSKIDDFLERGKTVFAAMGRAVRQKICGRGGVYPKLQRGEIGQDKLLEQLVVALLGGASLDRAAIVFFSVLLVRHGLSRYCEGTKAGGSSSL